MPVFWAGQMIRGMRRSLMNVAAHASAARTWNGQLEAARNLREELQRRRHDAAARCVLLASMLIIVAVIRSGW